jgi:2-methylcitrate dehydratase PrpD
MPLPHELANSVTGQLADLVLGIDPALVSDDDLTKAETCFLDWCAVALAALDDPIMRLMRDQALSEGGNPQARFLGSAQRGSAVQAALVNGTASHLYDYDDGASAIPGHPTVPVGSAVWALGEREGSSGRDVLIALIAGVEVMCRLGKALRPNHYAAGWHASGTLGAIAAAAACAKLLKLDRERTIWALGLAACRSSGLKAVFGSSAKPLQLGHAAALGLQSADLAARGFDCAPDVLEAEKGFLELHGSTFKESELFKPLAHPMAIHEARFKRHAACFLTHAPTEGALAFRRAHNLGPEQIAKIHIFGNPEVLTVCGNWEPDSGLAFKFSAPMVVAAALSGVETGALATFSTANARDPKLRALAAKVSIETSDRFEQEEAELVFEMLDGRKIPISATAAKSADTAADDQDSLLPKVRALLRPVYGDAGTESLIASFRGLHTAAKLPDIAAQ